MTPRSPTAAATPSDRHLDEVVRALAARNDDTAVIRVVEAWSEVGRPSQRARVAVGRAFHSLRLMDRAMARIREVLEEHPDDRDALRLLAEIYLDRGWPQRARAPLATLRAADEDVDELWERAHEEPIRPEADARAVERDGTATEQLALAEAFLATGSHLRASGILGRLRRLNPGHPRVRDLLWGLAGDFSTGGVSFATFVRHVMPVAPVRAPDAAEEPEHTESFQEADRFLLDDNPDSVDPGAFPSLFKHGAEPLRAPVDDGTEHTQSSVLASAEEMASDSGPETTDYESDAAGAGGGDTQIMLVLRPGAAARGKNHRRRSEDGDRLRETLNLREYQAEMGMSGIGDAPDSASEKEEVILEDEDADVVVMTRAERSPNVEATLAPDLDHPMEVVEKHARPMVRTVEPVLEPELPDPPSGNAGTSARLVAGVLAAVAVAALVVVAIVLVGGLNPRVETPVREELIRALADQDYEALLEQEVRLEQREAGRNASDVRAALAEARLVLWSDYNGDPARLAYITAVLAEPTGIDPHRVAFLRAADSLARADVAGAAAALGAELPLDDEEKLLVARLSARNRDTARALEQFTRMARPEAPRYRLAMADVLAQGGRPEEARKAIQSVLSENSLHAGAGLALLELAIGESSMRVAAADIYLTRFRSQSLAPRFEGRANVVRARAYAAMGLVGKAREAADAGLARDGTNPELLYVVAADEAAGGDHLGALRELDTVVSARPGDEPAQTARVLLLLDLERVVDAEAAVAALRDAQVLPGATPILEALVAVSGRQSAPATPLTPPQEATPLGAYVSALAAMVERRSDAAAYVERAFAVVQEAPDPFLRRLAPRLRAMAAHVAPAGSAATAAQEAEAVAGDDPAAHVLLGRYFEVAGRRALAAQHFDRAVSVGPQYGLALYEKGRFYQDANDNLGRTEQAWRAYLALAPSGPRADRVRRRLPLTPARP